jgi:hypothetical protein
MAKSQRPVVMDKLFPSDVWSWFALHHSVMACLHFALWIESLECRTLKISTLLKVVAFKDKD